jgi:hypothetical protein
VDKLTSIFLDLFRHELFVKMLLWCFFEKKIKKTKVGWWVSPGFSKYTGGGGGGRRIVFVFCGPSAVATPQTQHPTRNQKGD